MTKAFSILHRAAALLVAMCLLVGMALPVYAAEDGVLFFWHFFYYRSKATPHNSRQARV